MLFRITKYSIKNILRNTFLSISSVFVLTLLMVFINILVLLNWLSYKLIDSINSKLTISLYLDEKYGELSLDVKDLIEDINNLNTDVAVDFKSKEDILEEMRLKEPNLVKILERTNPLPDTIVLSNIWLSDYKKINTIIENRMYILSTEEIEWDIEEHFSNYTAQYKNIESVIDILDLLKMWLNVIIIIFLVSIATIIYSVIWNFIYYYKDEIYITKLVGWSNRFIYWPFVLQWIIYSLLAFIFNLVLFTILLNNLNSVFGYLYEFNFSNTLLLIEMLTFISIWGFSWFFSSRRYLS